MTAMSGGSSQRRGALVFVPAKEPPRSSSPEPPSRLHGDVLRLVSWHVLPPMVAISLACYLDRSNLSFASIHLNAELGFGPDVYGLGAGLFYAGA